MNGSNGKVKVLLVDDSHDDSFFIRRALDRAGMGECVHVVEDGEQAISYLRAEGKFADRQHFPWPTLILSDVNMPRMSGFELLRWIRDHQECKVIPIILFSSSAQQRDVIEAYRLGASSYMVKPQAPEELENMMRVTCEYWGLCERPPGRQKC